MKFSLILLLWSLSSQAAVRAVQEGIWNSRTQQWMSVEEFTHSIDKGDIVVMGEQHALPDNENEPDVVIHHDNQYRVIHQLTERSATEGFSVSTGMEFLTYTYQTIVDQFVANPVDEAQFLKDVHWGGNPFSSYRAQVLEPRVSGGRTLALNIPDEIPAKVAKQGHDSLTPAEQFYLPPIWEKGSAQYLERFSEIMGGHVKPEAVERYFWAQSLWDDTMAWKASEYRTSAPESVLVVIVGEFHVQYGHGLPAQLKRYGVSQIKTMVQVALPTWDPNLVAKSVAQDSKYGNVADFVWVYATPEVIRTRSFKPKLKNLDVLSAFELAGPDLE